MVQQVAGPQVAPGWFAGAMEIVMAPVLQRLTNIEARLDDIEAGVAVSAARLTNIEIRSYNLTASEPDDAIVPPRRGNFDPPAACPVSIGALDALTGQNMIAIETYYGLSVNPNGLSVQMRRRRIARTYGLFIKTVTVAST